MPVPWPSKADSSEQLTPDAEAFESSAAPATSQRVALTIEGIVQGVGFRPYVYRLACDLKLGGFVRNDTGAVAIEVEGNKDRVKTFLQRLPAEAPPLARIESIASSLIPLQGERMFRIEASTQENSQQNTPTVFIPADTATCPDCLRELFDPHDRRYQYPFLNCTNCGPRLTIIRGAPYDRQRTTMAQFEMCEDCRREFENPRDRRYHAQPIACPKCGPRLQLLNSEGCEVKSADPLNVFAQAIQSGQIGAMKGLGGFHLICDATNSIAVDELRKRKQREEKPLALMVENVEQARCYCFVSPQEKILLESPQRPIVLLQRRTGTPQNELADSIAPGAPQLGVMLPYTPLHHLLVQHLPGLPLVMTSGNLSDEPIVSADAEAVSRLGGIADLILTSNRPIHVRCDDSVTRIIDGQPAPLRRSRGWAPTPIRLPQKLAVPALAVGGQLKNTFALGAGQQAFVSHHIGDLDHLAARQAFEREITLYEELFAIAPRMIVHDLHPDYASTEYAQDRAKREGIELIPVQHHHAHIAAGMAEHNLQGPVIGLAFDGAGYGPDGTIWGGEFLIADYRSFQRVGHLRPIGLPGGDQATREPWRSAVAYLRDAGLPTSEEFSGVSPRQINIVEQMLTRSQLSPLTSSMGRLFDAVAALLGLRSRTSYEGQAAIELEWLATRAPEETTECYPFELQENSQPEESVIQGDVRSMIQALQDDCKKNVSKSVIARRFHSTIIELATQICCQIRTRYSLNQVVMGGGVFLNALILTGLTERLFQQGFHVYRQLSLPVNDSGLCLGQLTVAAARQQKL